VEETLEQQLVVENDDEEFVQVVDFEEKAG
jgi:hypothetical protein